MLSATEINAAIAARETEVDRLRRELEIAEAKLRGMKELRDQILGPSAMVALQARSLATAASSGGTPAFKITHHIGFRGGRQPGAISKPWRAILRELYHYNMTDEGGFSDSDVINVAKKQGIFLKPSDARLRMSNYREHKYIEDGAFADQWKVTDFAAQKFGFKSEPIKYENKAPTEQSEGAS